MFHSLDKGKFRHKCEWTKNTKMSQKHQHLSKAPDLEL